MTTLSFCLHIAVASVCLLLILPVPVLIARTCLLHVNCKCLLIAAIIAQMQLVVNHLSLYAYKLQHGLEENDIQILNITQLSDLFPEYQEWWLHGAAFSTSLNTAISIWLLIERLVAIRISRSYATITRPPAGIAVLCALSSLGYAVAFTYFISYKHYYMSSLAVESLWELIAIVLAFASYSYVRKIYGLLRGTRSLSERYQMHEVLEFNRAVLPVVACASMLKMISVTPSFFFFMGFISLSELQTNFFLIQSISSVIIKWMIFWTHPGLRRTIAKWRIFAPLRRHSVNPIQVEPSRVNEGEAYFGMLKTLWKE